jgi:hypothetical protein
MFHKHSTFSGFLLVLARTVEDFFEMYRLTNDDYLSEKLGFLVCCLFCGIFHCFPLKLYDGKIENLMTIVNFLVLYTSSLLLGLFVLVFVVFAEQITNGKGLYSGRQANKRYI